MISLSPFCFLFLSTLICWILCLHILDITLFWSSLTNYDKRIIWHGLYCYHHWKLLLHHLRFLLFKAYLRNIYLNYFYWWSYLLLYLSHNNRRISFVWHEQRCLVWVIIFVVGLSKKGMELFILKKLSISIVSESSSFLYQFKKGFLLLEVVVLWHFNGHFLFLIFTFSFLFEFLIKVTIDLFDSTQVSLV